MNMNWKSLTGALVLGIGVAACDVPLEETADNNTPDVPVTLDEGDQIPNVLARLDIGTSSVYFSEPAPGMIVVGEKAVGAPVLKQGHPSDPGALWATLAPDRAIPGALKQALARLRKAELEDKGVGKQQPTVAGAIGTTDADTVNPSPLNVGPGYLAVDRGAVQDPADFISYYCNAYSKPGAIAEACRPNRTTSSDDITPVSHSGNVHFARAAVAVYRGGVRFVPEVRSYFTWSTMADLLTYAGQANSWRVIRSNPSFGFRYRIINGAGDGFHFMHWLDDSAQDGWGLGTYRIPTT
jgi:hypothetical protein